ncbi:MAG TPA: LysM peptidoglycan-binding domain-containing protein [Hanamia sp.]
MIRRMMFIFIIVLTTNFLLAQGSGFEIKGTEGNIYLEHTVAPKESFFSISRMYNVSAKELASFNHTSLETPLKIGEVLKVPMTKTNFIQSGANINSANTVPVYHTMESGETLYRLGVNYNKVHVTSLKEWNHLQSDDVSAGTRMIVGFLKTDNASALLATNDAATKESNSAAIAAAIPAAGAAAREVATDASAGKPAASEMATANASSKVEPAFNGGYFKNLYNQQTANKSLVDKNGQAGVFKSTSGWQDGKYYCFNNDAAAGTVLKITNPATGKSVYAKVLDVIPDIKQNEGLSVILSNAAAGQIGAGENNFSCVLSVLK